MILGDSICYGDGVSREDSWVWLLSAALAKSAPECVVRNSGVNGSTARQGLQRLPGLLLQAPDLLYVQFGLNDAWQGVQLESYGTTMRDIVFQALEGGTGAVILSTNHPVCATEDQQEHGGKRYREAVRLFNACLRDFFTPRPERVTMVDMERFFESFGGSERQAGLLQPDGVHLSAEGNAAYFRRLEPVFRAGLCL
jgi:acyl-CoA thioesterase-1